MLLVIRKQMVTILCSGQVILFTCQETGELRCYGNYLNRVPKAPKWYTKSDISDEHRLQFVVLADLTLEAISEQSPLPNTYSKTVAREMNALKVSKESDDYIVDEIIRRDALEDPEYERYDTEEEEDESGEEEDDEEE